MKQKARLVLQDIRKGATRPEKYSPTPSLTSMQAYLLMTAKAGHEAVEANVRDISRAFLYADLPKEKQVVCYRPRGTPGSKDESRTQDPYLVVKSLYGLRQAPSLWAKALGPARSLRETLAEIHTE
eukprot:2648927-Amphidinium_carterae.2